VYFDIYKASIASSYYEYIPPILLDLAEKRLPEEAIELILKV